MAVRSGPVRFGVIGCGGIAYWAHLRAFRSARWGQVVALADPDRAALDRARQLVTAEAYDDPYPLLRRDDVDAVIISAPTHLHASLALTSVRAGKHLYIEKPVATTIEEAAEVTDLVQRAGVRAVVGFNRRYHPLFRQARVLIARGVIGPVRSVLSTFSEPTPEANMPAWKRSLSTGGGVLLDLASHHIDLLRWILGDEVAGARAATTSSVTGQDQAWLHLRMRGGIEAQGYFSFVAGPADFLEFIGERGSLRVDRHRPALSIRVPRRFGYGTRPAFPFPPGDVWKWWPRRLVSPSFEPSHGRSLEAFAAAIGGAATDLATLEDGTRSLEAVVEAGRA